MFSELFAEHRIHGDADLIAEAIVEALRLRPAQAEALSPLILHECQDLERRCVLRIERSGGRACDPLADRRLYLETFSLGSGRSVLWGLATVDDHSQRIANLTAHQAGVAETIARHEDAIVRIQAAGVSCLGEIEEAA